MRDKAILCVYGVGGHQEQMKRLLKHLDIKSKSDKVKIVAMCEKNGELEGFDECIVVPDMRNKYRKRRAFVDAPRSILVSMVMIYKILRKYDIDVMISSGPGLVLPVAVIFKLLNKKVIFIETWSRFDTRSVTGKAMHKLSDVFYVQNRSLMGLYDNAIYAGRL